MGRANRRATIRANRDDLTALGLPNLDHIGAVDPQVAVAHAVGPAPAHSNFSHLHQCSTNAGLLPTTGCFARRRVSRAPAHTAWPFADLVEDRKATVGLCESGREAKRRDAGRFSHTINGVTLAAEDLPME